VEPASPQVRQRSGPSIVWLIPLLTALVGGWLIYKTLSEKGPEVTISFRTAEGIEAGKTRVKYKNVDIGVVDRVRFSEDLTNVIVHASFNKGTESFFRRNTRIWVVRPQLSLRGATGLGTLISGAYVEVEPGRGAPQLHFVGLEKAPLVTADEAGMQIALVTDKLRSVDTGSPIYYRGVLAGEVLGHELGNDGRSIFIHAFIKDPFDQLVRGNTRFWNVSGMDVTMGADGLRIRTESLQSLIFGGIAFETPPSLERTPLALDNLIFTLHNDYDSILEQAYTKKVQYVMFFDGSVRGLSAGAPVEFKGIRVGSVLDIRLEYDAAEEIFRIPVLVELEPERIIEREGGAAIEPYETLARLVDKGLRARLQTGSLLTGQLFVELGMHPDTPVNLAGADLQYPELPTIAGASLESITQAVDRFVARLDQVQIDRIGVELLSTLEGANKVINSPIIQAAVDDLGAALESLRSILGKVDEANIGEAIDAGHVALEKLGTTLDLTSRLLEPSSPLHYNLIQTTRELEETARSIRSLVETLERHPQALIFGKDAKGE
jgi:paraquat-inducible protein B